MTEKKKVAVGPLSHSSASTLQECEQRYTYYKIEGAPTDPDYQKPDSLALGSAFHKILEDSKHEKPASLRTALLACVEDPDIKLPENDLLLCHAMVLKYLRLHSQMGLKVLAVEIELKTKEFLGYVDAILEDDEGLWWVVDLKTSKSLNPTAIAMLPKDPQLNLYAAHASIIAEMLSLDLQKFGGTRWRVVTKSTAKRKNGESESDFVMRLVDNNIKAYDIPVPFDPGATDERLEAHLVLHKRTVKLAKTAPTRNYKSCNSYFSPCPYWSRCYGKTHTEMLNFPNMTVLA